MTQYMSWSSLRTHIECKQRNFLNKSGKRAPLSDQRVFFPGNVVDRVVRYWLEGHPEDNLGKMPSMVEKVIDLEKHTIEKAGGVMKWKDSEDRNQITRDCIEAVEIIEPAMVEKVLPFEYQADFRFKAPLLLPSPAGFMDTVVLNGALDILVRDPKKETWSVYDVKMTRDSQYYKKTMGQLGFYDLCLFVMFGQYASDVALFQPLASPPVKEIPLNSVTRSKMMSQVMEMATDVWMENTEPRADNKYCGYCDVKHACSKFQPVQQADGKRRLSFGMNL